ncbi:hypothetical protein EP7_001508 [Isosphaeraceae bacterium EP7]
MTVFQQLQQLIETFERDIQLAKGLETTNADDDLAIKAAIVGFSYASATGEWAKGHFDFVRSRIEDDYSTEELREYGENSDNVKFFFALANGYLLGLYHQEEISNLDFKRAEAQIPGLILLHLGKLTSHRL